MIIKKGVWRRWKKVLTGVYLVLGLAGLYSWIDWKSSAFVVGALALLYTPAFGRHPTGSFRFGWMALIFSAIFIFLPVKTVLYAVFVCAVLLFRETFYRRIEPSVPVVLLLMTPVTEYFVRQFGFPVRLQLTILAGHILRLTGQPVVVAGNILTYRGHSFSVDPACIGLHMVVASLLTAFLLMNYYQSRYKQRLRPLAILLLLIAVIALNIIANLVRISSLVLLLILPDNPIHGLLGIIVLVTYVLLPMIPFVRRVTRHWGRPVEEGTTGVHPVRRRRVLAGNWLAGVCVTLVVVKSGLKENQPVEPWPENTPVAGYTVKRLTGPVLLLNNGRSLVYIKPIPDFYYTEHSPLICWEGSGYQFGQVQRRQLHGTRLYEGLLQKGAESLYTAWWYDNGLKRTDGSLDWRWDVLRGGPPYSIINVTAGSPKVLEEEVDRVLATQPFRQLLTRRVKI